MEAPEPFGMKRAVRQHFIDGILAALNARGADGYPYGWHLISMSNGENGTGEGTVTMVFQTPTPLKDWKDGQMWSGPHYVKVTVDAHTLTQDDNL